MVREGEGCMTTIGPLYFKDSLSGKLLKALYLDGDELIAVDCSSKGSTMLCYDFQLFAITGVARSSSLQKYHDPENKALTTIIRVLLDPRVTVDQANKSLRLIFDLNHIKLLKMYGAGWLISSRDSNELIRLEDILNWIQ